MKPSEPAIPMTSRVIPFLGRAASRRVEREFLPAALEIIETPASPAGRAIAGTIIGFLCVATAWAAFGQVDIIATTQGRIIPSGKTKLIQPFETGVVRAIHVSDGALVKEFDVLVELDPTSDAADEKRLAYDLAQDRLDIARLNALLAGNTALFAAPADAEPPCASDGPPADGRTIRRARSKAGEHRPSDRRKTS